MPYFFSLYGLEDKNEWHADKKGSLNRTILKGTLQRKILKYTILIRIAYRSEGILIRRK